MGREREQENVYNITIPREKVSWNLVGSTVIYENESFPVSESLARLLLSSAGIKLSGQIEATR